MPNETPVDTMTTMISPGIGIGSFFLKRSFTSLTVYKKAMQMRPRIRVLTLVLVMSLSTALTLWRKAQRVGIHLDHLTSQLQWKHVHWIWLNSHKWRIKVHWNAAFSPPVGTWAERQRRARPPLLWSLARGAQWGKLPRSQTSEYLEQTVSVVAV